MHSPDVSALSPVADSRHSGRLRETTLAASLEHVYLFDVAGRYVYVSPAACAALGLEQTDIVGKSWRDVGFPPAVMERIDAQREHVLQTGHSVVSELTFAVVEGLRDYEYVISPVRDAEGRIVQAVCISRDITERKRMELALRQNEAESRRRLAELQTIYATAPAGLCFLDTHLRYVSINDQLAALNGLPAAAHIGKTLREMLPQFADTFEPLLLRILETGEPLVNLEIQAASAADPNVERYWLLSYYPARDKTGELLGINAVVIDITRHKQVAQALEEANRTLSEANARLEAQVALSQSQAAALEDQKAELEAVNARLEALATTDGLTELKNYRVFQERLVIDVERSARYGESLSLLLIDVDRFKPFNDTFGHPAGDRALRAVAGLLHNCARAADFVARYGGEEFAVILPATDTSGALEAAERFRAAVESHAWEQRAITVSIGVSTLQADNDTPQTLIDRADRALYHAKQSGRNCISNG